jgi:hypothetical protein
MGERRGACRVLMGRPKERDQFESLELNGRIILKWRLKKLDSGMDLIDVVQNRYRWLAAVNAITFGFRKMRAIS